MIHAFQKKWQIENAHTFKQWNVQIPPHLLSLKAEHDPFLSPQGERSQLQGNAFPLDSTADETPRRREQKMNQKEDLSADLH